MNEQCLYSNIHELDILFWKHGLYMKKWRDHILKHILQENFLSLMQSVSSLRNEIEV